MDTADLHPLPLPPETKPKPGWAAWAGQIGNGLLGAAIMGSLIWLVLPRFEQEIVALIALLPTFVVSVWLHIVLHEVGHAIAGLATGYKPVAFGLGPLRFERSGDGWFLRQGGWLNGIGGFAVMLPSADALPQRRRLALYFLGGPLLNLLTGVPALLLASTAPPGPWMVLGLGFGAAGLVLGVSNLLPLKVNGVFADGAHLLRLRSDPEGSLGGFRMLQLAKLDMDGQRPRDWPARLLPEHPLPDLAIDSPWVATHVTMRLKAAIDRREAGRARDCARWLAARWPHIPMTERPAIALTMAEHAALVEDDLALLQAWRPLVTDDPLIDLSCYQAWLDAEIAFREGRQAEARTLLAKARAALPRIREAGTRVVVTEYLDALEARLSPRPVEVPPASQPS